MFQENNIGWVARPKHNPRPGPGEGEPFVRRGKFKKASNMNYAMWVSTRVEEKLAQLDEKMWSEKDAYSHALNEIISEDQGRTWAQGISCRFLHRMTQWLIPVNYRQRENGRLHPYH